MTLVPQTTTPLSNVYGRAYGNTLEGLSRIHQSPAAHSLTLGAPACAADRAVRAALQAVADEQRQAVARRWKDLHRALTSDRGVWAGQDPGPLHWKLDPHEDRCAQQQRQLQQR